MTTTTSNPADPGVDDSTGGDPLARRVVGKRHRVLALPGGVVLALCIFLPALRVCGSATYPITMPPFWGPYLLGLVVVFLALAPTWRALRAPIVAAQIIVVGTGGFLAVVSADSHDGALWTAGAVVAVVGFLLFTVRAHREAAAIAVVVFTGAVSTAWFALIAFDPDGMFGAWISLGASLVLTVAGLEWWRELRAARVDPVPRAIARAA